MWNGNGTSSLVVGLPGRTDLPNACVAKPKTGHTRLVLVLYVEGLAWSMPRSLGGTRVVAILAKEGTPLATGSHTLGRG